MITKTQSLHEHSSKVALCLQQAEKIHWSDNSAQTTWLVSAHGSMNTP